MPLSNNTVSHVINYMSSNVETTVIQLIENSSYTIQLDESTDVANLTVLLVFA